MEDLWHALRWMNANRCHDDAGLVAELVQPTMFCKICYVYTLNQCSRVKDLCKFHDFNKIAARHGTG